MRLQTRGVNMVDPGEASITVADMDGVFDARNDILPDIPDVAPQGHAVARATVRQKKTCEPACNFGSDSHLMIFDADLVLFSKRNQHHGLSFAFIFIGAVRIDR